MKSLVYTGFLSLAFCGAITHAEAGQKAKSPPFSPYIHQTAQIVMTEKGEILIAKNSDRLCHPASLTKLATLALVFKALKDDRLKLSDLIPVSVHAASAAPTRLGLKAGTRISVENAIKALVATSANDAAIAFAEWLGGTEELFAKDMTDYMHAAGMPSTFFRNASGLPDAQQVSTARDIARLLIHIRQAYPEYYPFLTTKDYIYEGSLHKGHNKFLKTYPGTEGSKTGYTFASNFHVAAVVSRFGERLVGVVIGDKTASAASDQLTRIMDMSFHDLSKRKKSHAPGDIIAYR